MTPEQFIEKWKASTRTEKSASQEHFLDLCELLEVPKPGDVDPHGAEYTLEKAVKKPGGGSGSADVWKKDCFAWEYKGNRKNLVAAYTQVKEYADALQNPPLLIHRAALNQWLQRVRELFVPRANPLETIGEAGCGFGSSNWFGFTDCRAWRSNFSFGLCGFNFAAFPTAKIERGLLRGFFILKSF